MLKIKSFILPEVTTVSKDILTGYINLFWKEIFKPLHSSNTNMHLMVMVKVEFTESSLGYRTLADLRRINYSDKELFTEFLIGRLGYLSEAYKVTPFSKIVFSYIIKDGLADNTRLLLKQPVYEVTTHAYNSLVLPLTMDPFKYGTVLAKEFISEENLQRFIIRNDNTIFLIDVSSDGNTNNVTITGPADIKWVDTKVSDNTFRRDIGKNTLYIMDNKIIVKTKQLGAKPFKSVNTDTKLNPIDTFMTIDIETVNIDGKLHPYLICGYSSDNYIHSYAKDITLDAQTEMFKAFITQIIDQKKKVKYIYAHNLSGFDGIFLLKHLIKYEGAKVEPLVFNGKLVSIKFIFGTGKNKRTIVFKDSFLLLPMSLRKLCVAFNVPSHKSYFPFGVSNIDYVGELPSFEYWSDISQDEYNLLLSKYTSEAETQWSFKDEAIKYCKLDCKCLFDVLVKFNELIFNEFKLNIHSSLTTPSLAMNIYKSQFMPKDTLYQILGNVEKDIRESYTGGAVDVYIPHNKLDKNFYFDTRHKLYYYDVNSLYPFVMSSLQMPVGKPIAFEGNIRLLEPEAYGFFYCKITSPKAMEHPILQRRIKTQDGVRTIAGLGTWEGWVFSMEMDNAERFGYQFEIIRGYKFKSAIIFKEYVNKMYALRQKYPKNDPMNLIAKLLMNSLYGKFGMKPEHSTVDIYNNSTDEGRQHFKWVLDTFGESIQDYIKLDDIYIIIRKNLSSYQYDESKDLFHGIDVSIPVAAAITAGGRMWMTQFKNNPNFNLYYSDTDSVVIDEALTEAFVGSKLGQLKLEYEISRAVFLAPKVYGFVSIGGDEIIKVKGITKNVLKTIHIQDLENLLVKDSNMEFTQAKWSKKVIEGDISISDVAYNLKITSNKRENIYYDDIFSDTKPYRYNEIEKP